MADNNTQKLSIDIKMLFKSLSPGQRDAFFSTESGEEWLKALTPSEYADLFPDYITERNRRASASVSGGTSVGSGGMRPYQSWIPGNQSHRGVGRRGMGPSGGYDSRGSSSGGSGSGSTVGQGAATSSLERRLADKIRALGLQKGITPYKPPVTGRLGKGETFLQIRSRQMKELDDPRTRAAVYARAELETGGQSKKAQSNWLETLFNRADAAGVSVYEAAAFDVLGRGPGGTTGKHRYYPKHNTSKFESLMRNPQETIKRFEKKYGAAVSSVGVGLNNTDFATDNASNIPGKRLADERFKKYGGIFEDGELSYVNSPYKKWADARRNEEREALANATKTEKRDGSSTGRVGISKFRHGLSNPIDHTQELDKKTRANKGYGYGSREKVERYDYVGIHYTGGKSLESLLSSASKTNHGYNFAVDQQGNWHMLKDPDVGATNHWGGSSNKSNIHPRAKNANSISVAFIGDSNTMSKAAQESMLAGLNELVKSRGIDPRNVLGHGEVSAAGHRHADEGYGILTLFRQQNGLTPETGNMPDIASKEGIEAWKAAKYNHSLNFKDIGESFPTEIRKEVYDALPEDFRKTFDRMSANDKREISHYLNQMAERDGAEKISSEVSALYKDVVGQLNDGGASAKVVAQAMLDAPPGTPPQALNLSDTGLVHPLETATMEYGGHGKSSHATHARKRSDGSSRTHAGADLYAIDPKTGKMRSGEDQKVFAPVDGRLSVRNGGGGAGMIYEVVDSKGMKYKFLHSSRMGAINPETGKPWKSGDKVTRGQHLTWVAGTGANFDAAVRRGVGGGTGDPNNFDNVTKAIRYFEKYGWGDVTPPHAHFEVRDSRNRITNPKTGRFYIDEMFPEYDTGPDNLVARQSDMERKKQILGMSHEEIEKKRAVVATQEGTAPDQIPVRGEGQRPVKAGDIPRAGDTGSTNVPFRRLPSESKTTAPPPQASPQAAPEASPQQKAAISPEAAASVLLQDDPKSNPSPKQNEKKFSRGGNLHGLPEDDLQIISKKSGERIADIGSDENLVMADGKMVVSPKHRDTSALHKIISEGNHPRNTQEQQQETPQQRQSQPLPPSSSSMVGSTVPGQTGYSDVEGKEGQGRYGSNHLAIVAPSSVEYAYRQSQQTTIATSRNVSSAAGNPNYGDPFAKIG